MKKNIAGAALCLNVALLLIPAAAKEYVLCDTVCGLVDEQGHAVLQRVFEKIYAFHGDYALFFQQGRWGLVDRQGKTVAWFPNKQDFDAKVKPEAWLSGFWLRLSRVETGSTYDVFHPNGTLSLENVGRIRRSFSARREQEELPFMYRIAETGLGTRIDLYDLSGSVVQQLAVLPPEKIAPLMPAKDYATQRWGYLNQQMQWAIKPQFMMAEPFSTDSAEVDSGAGWMLINTKGQPLNSFRYTKRYSKLSDSWLSAIAVKRFADISEQEWVLHRNGDAFPIRKGIEVDTEFRHDVARISEKKADSKKIYGLINSRGKILITPIYAEYNAISYPSELLTVLSYPTTTPRTVSLWSAEGKRLLATDFDDLRLHRDLPHILAKQGGWGLINRQGQWLIPPIYPTAGWGDYGNINMTDANNKSYSFNHAGQFLPEGKPEPLLVQGQAYRLVDWESGSTVSAPIQLQSAPLLAVAANNRADQSIGVYDKKLDQILIQPRYPKFIQWFDEQGRAITLRGSKEKNPYTPILIDLQGNELASFASVWPQFSAIEEGSQAASDPCLIEDPVTFSASKTASLPSFCAEPNLHAQIKHSLKLFYQTINSTNAQTLLPWLNTYRLALARNDEQLMAQSQAFERQLNAIPKARQQRMTKSDKKVPLALRKALYRTIAQMDPDYSVSNDGQSSSAIHWQWIDLNHDGKNEVNVNISDSGRYFSNAIFAKNRSGKWKLIFAEEGISDLQYIQDAKSSWPLLKITSSGSSDGTETSFRYLHGHYQAAQSCNYRWQPSENAAIEEDYSAAFCE